MAISGGYGPSASVINQYGINQSPGISASTAWQTAGAISGVAGAISSVFAGQTQAIGYEMQAAARRAQASTAVSNAKMTSMRLQQNYNDMAANNMVKYAAQGRNMSSGSIQNLMRVDQEKLQWDMDYAQHGGEAGKAGIMADAIGYDAAAEGAKMGGIQKGLLQIAGTAIDYKSIK